MMEEPAPQGWSEENSNTFIDFGRYFIPERESQLDMLCRLVPDQPNPPTLVELCCGEGLLAEALLRRFPQARLIAFDGSSTMLNKARQRLESFGSHFQLHEFDLAAHDWRNPTMQANAILSSLAIHHLTGEEKQVLFTDLYKMLAPGGVLVISDLIMPASRQGITIAAEAWDAAVRHISLELDNDLNVYKTFEELHWNMYRYNDADDIDHPSSLFEQLCWLESAGFQQIDVYWLQAGHAIFGGSRLD
jgi:tRNA (cmo5U34)-methyltransferase